MLGKSVVVQITSTDRERERERDRELLIRMYANVCTSVYIQCMCMHNCMHILQYVCTSVTGNKRMNVYHGSDRSAWDYYSPGLVLLLLLDASELPNRFLATEGRPDWAAGPAGEACGLAPCGNFGLPRYGLQGPPFIEVKPKVIAANGILQL